MSTTLKPLYGSAGSSITITSAATLANGAYAGSAVIDNSTSLAEDALVTVTPTAAAAGVSSTGTVTVYAYGTTDGTHYTDGVTGTDAAQTPSSPTNLKRIGQLNVNANNAAPVGGPFSIAAAFNNNMPQKWGIVVLNSTGAALAGFTANYQLINDQQV